MLFVILRFSNIFCDPGFPNPRLERLISLFKTKHPLAIFLLQGHQSSMYFCDHGIGHKECQGVARPMGWEIAARGSVLQCATRAIMICCQSSGKGRKWVGEKKELSTLPLKTVNSRYCIGNLRLTFWLNDISIDPANNCGGRQPWRSWYNVLQLM